MTTGLRSGFAALALAIAAQSASADLIIEEIVDATLVGGQPKWVEVKNIGTDCAYLGDYELCVYNNGSSTVSGCVDLLEVFLDAGASYVFAYESSSNIGPTKCSTLVTCFESVYGMAPAAYGGPAINGDDAVALRVEATGSIVDVYGVIGVDGTGTAWEYLDSWSRRNGTVTAANATFDTTEWTFGGANALDGKTAGEIAVTTSPGTYTACVPPIVAYCTSGPSASGCISVISGAGMASASATTGFTLMATNVEGNKNGLFYFGTTGRQNTPWGFAGSRMCVAAPRYRTPLQFGVGTPGLCDGTFTLDLNAVWCSTCPLPLKNPGAGVVCDAQLWYRDPFNTGGNGTSTSGGLEFTTGP